MVTSRFACTVGSIRAKLPQRRVRFAANTVRTVRGQNQAVNGSSGTSFNLLSGLAPEPRYRRRSNALESFLI